MPIYTISNLTFGGFDYSTKLLSFSFSANRDVNDTVNIDITNGYKYGIDSDILSESSENTPVTFISTDTTVVINFTINLDSISLDTDIIWVSGYYLDPNSGEELSTEPIEIAIDYASLIPVDAENYQLLNGIRIIHGSLLYGDYIWGSSRSYSGIVKINKNDFSDITVYDTPIGKTSPVQVIEEIVRIDDYIYGLAIEGLVQINIATGAMKLFTGVNSIRSYPIHGDDAYLYCQAIYNNLPIEIPVEDRVTCRYVYKISHASLIDAPNLSVIGYYESTITPVAMWDRNTQGAHIDYPTEYPNTLLKDLFYNHACLSDDTYLYFSFTSGPDDTEERPRCEFHKVNKHTMESAGWCFIPAATDDMAQNEEYIFISLEVYDSDGYKNDKSIVFIDKETLTPKYLPYLSHVSQTGAGFMATKFGKFLVVGNTDKNIYILDTSNVASWSEDSEKGEYVVDSFRLDLPTTTGTPNEVMYDEETDAFYFFVWTASGSDSAITRVPLETIEFSLPAYYIQGSVFTDKTATEKVDGAMVLITKVGESVPFSQIVTGVDGVFSLKLTDNDANSYYVIDGYLQSNNQPIVPKLVKPIFIE